MAEQVSGSSNSPKLSKIVNLCSPEAGESWSVTKGTGTITDLYGVLSMAGIGRFYKLSYSSLYGIKSRMVPFIMGIFNSCIVAVLNVISFKNPAITGLEPICNSVKKYV